MRTLDKKTIQRLADHLEKAELGAFAVCKITDEYSGMTFTDATDIQWQIRRNKEARGTKIVGMKMGLTSWAKMAQMGVDQPCYGFLADYFCLPDGATVATDELIHPKVEAELALVTNKPLQGSDVSIEEVLDATDIVVPAVEIIDSRYKDFRFDITSVQADNSSSTRFMVGSRSAAADAFDWSTLGVVMLKNGEVVEMGAGAAVLDHPANSVAMLAKMLSERDEIIPAGSFIMTGGITAAVPVQPGDSIVVRYQYLGDVTLQFI